MPIPDRRTLEFAQLEDVMTDVDRLLRGHRTVGAWSLGQICRHLAEAFRLAIEGAPVRAPWLVRATIGRVAKAMVLGLGRMPTGMEVPVPSLRPGAGLDDRAEAEALRAAIAAYHAGRPLEALHPLFGRLTAAETNRFHRIHCAHHLSFAIPA